MALAMRMEARNLIGVPTCEVKLPLVPLHRELDTQSWIRDSIMNERNPYHVPAMY